jgi:hypothetical protein
VINEAVKVKSKLQWGPQDVRDVKNMEYLPRKTTGKEWSQPRREAIWPTTDKAIGAGLSKPAGSSHHDTICSKYQTLRI